MALEFSWADGERVMFIGDVVTDDPLGYTRLIPAMVTARYPDRRIAYYPRGSGGNRIGDVLEKLLPDLLGNLQKPTWVGVSLGLNDVQEGAAGTPLGRFQELYEELLLELKDWKARIACLTTTVRGEDLNNADNRKLIGYNEVIRAIGFKHGVEVIDVNQAFQIAIKRAQSVNPDFHYTIDGEHLNEYGNYLMTMTVLQSLNFDLRMREQDAGWQQAA